MKHIIIDQHANLCHCHKDSKEEKCWLSNYCTLNPERFLFFHDNDFHVITYFKCMTYGNHNDFKEELLSIFIGKYSKAEVYDLSRSWEVEGALKESRLRGVEFNVHLHEINYVYSDVTGKEYAIAVKRDLNHKLISNDTIEKNYELALNKINSDENLKGSKYLKDKLKELKHHNMIYISDAEVIKSTKHLITKFKKQIKEKTN